MAGRLGGGIGTLFSAMAVFGRRRHTARTEPRTGIAVDEAGWVMLSYLLEPPFF
jgi:hypothetical protein